MKSENYQVEDYYVGKNLKGVEISGVVVARYPSQSRMSIEDSNGERHLVWLK